MMQLASNPQDNRNRTRIIFYILMPIILSFALPLVSLEIWKFCSEKNPDIYKIYSTIYRTPLFAGFITAGSFLFSVKTFSIFRIHDEVFKDQSYQKKHIEDVRLGEKKEFLEPLMNFSDYLFASILLSFISSIAQLTIGAIPNDHCSIISLSLAFSAFTSIIISLFFLKMNLEEWFDIRSAHFADDLTKIKNQIDAEVKDRIKEHGEL
ncbi:hypothetical protein [Geothrix rubra]|uniref:hypothetical protein n=1 Tax=Geothrix rubra TaxID=2927977 RepID=UPI00255324F6|nr:hypothetical protein [Geothrix rubra]